MSAASLAAFKPEFLPDGPRAGVILLTGENVVVSAGPLLGEERTLETGSTSNTIIFRVDVRSFVLTCM